MSIGMSQFSRALRAYWATRGSLLVKEEKLSYAFQGIVSRRNIGAAFCLRTATSSGGQGQRPPKWRPVGWRRRSFWLWKYRQRRRAVGAARQRLGLLRQPVERERSQLLWCSHRSDRGLAGERGFSG